MSKFKISFTLKQHTPIIHFQANQSGATLRATELKPKFDKFLKKYAFDGNIPEVFKIDKEKDAIDYKVNIEPNYNNKEEIHKRDALFFANMKPKNINDDEWEKYGKKYFKNYKNNFKITFFSYKIKILEAIEKNFECFLANTNFGSRQSKGFGSFYLSDKTFDKDLIKANRVFSFYSSNWKEDIKLFYSFLRQGVNIKNHNRETVFYTKPMIYLYFKKYNIEWEKSAIKQAILNNKKVNTSKHKIIRDLFGLSTYQYWISYNKGITKNHIATDDKKIVRLQSPITFKVIDNTIYFWVNKNYNKLLNQPFKINNKLKLYFPDKFDIDDFFNFVINVNLDTIIHDQYKKNENFYKLKDIINKIKASL